MKGISYYYPPRPNINSPTCRQIQTEFEPALNKLSEFSVNSPFNHTPKIVDILKIHNVTSVHKSNNGKRSKRQGTNKKVAKNPSENQTTKEKNKKNIQVLDQFQIRANGQKDKFRMDEMVSLIKQYQLFNSQLIKQSEENVEKFNDYLNNLQNQCTKKIQQLQTENQQLRQSLSEKEKSFETLQFQTAKWMEDYQELHDEMNKEIIAKYEITIKEKDQKLQQLQKCFENLQREHEDNINYTQTALTEKQKIILEITQLNNQLCSKISQQRCRHHDCSEIKNWVKEIVRSNSDSRQELQKVRSEVQFITMKTNFENHKQIFEQEKAEIIEQLQLVIQEKDELANQLEQTQQYVESLKKQLSVKDKQINDLKNDRKTVSKSTNLDNTYHRQKSLYETSKFEKTGLHYDWSQTFLQQRKINNMFPIKQQNYYANANKLQLQTEKNKNQVLMNALKVQQILNSSLRKRLDVDAGSTKKNHYQNYLQEHFFTRKIQTFQQKIAQLDKLFFKVKAFLQSLFTDKTLISKNINSQIYQQITYLKDVLATERYIYEKFQTQLMEKIIKHLPKNIIQEQSKENTPQKYGKYKNNHKKHQRSRTGLKEGQATTRMSILGNMVYQKCKNTEKLRY